MYPRFVSSLNDSKLSLVKLCVYVLIHSSDACMNIISLFAFIIKLRIYINFVSFLCSTIDGNCILFFVFLCWVPVIRTNLDGAKYCYFKKASNELISYRHTYFNLWIKFWRNLFVIIPVHLLWYVPTKFVKCEFFSNIIAQSYYYGKKLLN